MKLGDAVDHGSLDTHVADGVADGAVGRLEAGQKDFGRGKHHPQDPLLLHLAQVPAVGQGIAIQGMGKVLKGDEEPGFVAAFCPLVQELHAHRRLARSRGALDHGHRVGQQSSM